MSDSHLCGFTVVKDFVLIGQHTCPKHAMKEIDQLYNVFTGIHKKWKTDVGYALTSFASWIHPRQNLWVIPPFCTRPERGDPGRPQRWLQLRHHQRLEGPASEERPQVSLADRGRAGHDGSREDALCIRQVRDSLIMTWQLLVHSPFNIFYISKQDHCARTWDDFLHCSRLSSTIQL